ncbi:MAG TPA: hypothetical protein VMX11_02300 [Actinomycetes bacterium]|nr:hypothetical protein [Actinomycetes bacterium]
MTLVIKSNPAQATAVLVRDMGIIIPPTGGSETFTSRENIDRAAASTDLFTLATDDAHGVGSSTLILNNGTADIQQSNVGSFLSNIDLEPYIGTTGLLPGVQGLVPAPTVFDGAKFPRGDGVWADPALGVADYAGRFETASIGTGDIPDGKWGWWFDTNVPNRLLHIRNRGGTLYATEANPL